MESRTGMKAVPSGFNASPGETGSYQQPLPTSHLRRPGARRRGLGMTHPLPLLMRNSQFEKGDRPVNRQLQYNVLIIKTCTKWFENKEGVSNSAWRGQKSLHRGEI